MTLLSLPWGSGRDITVVTTQFVSKRETFRAKLRIIKSTLKSSWKNISPEMQFL